MIPTPIQNSKIKGSVGANKDIRQFYSTTYTAEFNRDNELNKPRYKPIINFSDYNRPRQLTGFVENNPPFISADGTTIDQRSKMYCSITGSDYNSKPIDSQYSVSNCACSGFTHSRKTTVSLTRTDHKLDRYEAKLDKNYAKPPYQEHKLDELATSVYQPNGYPVSRDKVSIDTKKRTPFAKEYESSIHQNQMFGKFGSICYQGYSTEYGKGAHEKVNLDTLPPIINSKLDTVYVKSVTSPAWYSVTPWKEEQKVSSARGNFDDLLKKRLRDRSIGSKECTGHIRENHKTLLYQHEAKNTGSTEMQDRYCRSQSGKQSVWIKSAVANSGFTQANTNRATLID